ncbi:MAG: hypothetical protein JWP81_865 [Ferruginibacter sp.]|nr:hypothetical protein [Ferruginibacter sp.]
MWNSSLNGLFLPVSSHIKPGTVRALKQIADTERSAFPYFLYFMLFYLLLDFTNNCNN